jgi:hypothetical protein
MILFGTKCEPIAEGREPLAIVTIAAATANGMSLDLRVF